MTSSQPKKSQPSETAVHANNAASLRKALEQCMIRDRFRLSKRISGASKINKEASRNAVFDEIALDIAKSMMEVEQRHAQRITIEYPEILPVSQKKDDIAKAIAEHQVVIVAGETGSGKTTQLPKICAELGRGKFGLIGHTQPRRLRHVRSQTVLLKKCRPNWVSLSATKFDLTIKFQRILKSS